MWWWWLWRCCRSRWLTMIWVICDRDSDDALLDTLKASETCIIIYCSSYYQLFFIITIYLFSITILSSRSSPSPLLHYYHHYLLLFRITVWQANRAEPVGSSRAVEEQSVSGSTHYSCCNDCCIILSLSMMELMMMMMMTVCTVRVLCNGCFDIYVPLRGSVL